MGGKNFPAKSLPHQFGNAPRMVNVRMGYKKGYNFGGIKRKRLLRTDVAKLGALKKPAIY